MRYALTLSNTKHQHLPTPTRNTQHGYGYALCDMDMGYAICEICEGYMRQYAILCAVVVVVVMGYGLSLSLSGVMRCAMCDVRYAICDVCDA
jgi:hypothetical protein